MKSTIDRLRQRRQELGDEGGFTLIELLIVIVILGILAAIVVFAVQNLTGSSAKSACGADYKTVETAAEAYKAQEGVVAPAMNDLTGVTAPVHAGDGPWLKEAPSGTHYFISVHNGVVGVGATQAAADTAAAGTGGNTCSTVAT